MQPSATFEGQLQRSLLLLIDPQASKFWSSPKAFLESLIATPTSATCSDPCRAIATASDCWSAATLSSPFPGYIALGCRSIGAVGAEKRWRSTSDSWLRQM